ncbi:hypothetical protein M3Y98_00688500 [Aphelenchoides besseyi]|nr:hypothetical protein M3Y98_00688500 [Aphelenchoides besseyi]
MTREEPESCEAAEINRLQRSVADCLARVDGLASKNQKLESELGFLRTKISDDSTDHRNVLNRKDNEIERLREQGDHLRSELDDLKAKKASLAEQLVRYRELLQREDPPTKIPKFG